MESLTLSWDATAAVTADLDGKRPVLVFRAEGQKSGKAEVVPVMPDFGRFLLATPEAERVGKVFPLVSLATGRPMMPHLVGKIVSAIGKRAGVIVNADGKPASAHDFRRSFATRNAKRVMPAVLKRLMRHSSVTTTMGYYVDLDADTLAEELWTEHGDRGNIGNKSGNNADFREEGQRDDFAENPYE